MYRMVRLETIICVLFVASKSTAQDAPEVTTPLGKIQGYYKTSYEGKKFAAFEGIPYAHPPVGDLRFKEPHMVQPWNGIWSAKLLHSCLQKNAIFTGGEIRGQEDCLYINVYSPNAIPDPDSNFDVVVHIHGGAFMMGYGHMVHPNLLVDRNYVFVSFNYRIGVLGFFCTMNPEHDVSCNNGLKDQTLALKWIKENIKSFGGNPNSVTITGTSAGGASVHFHYLSPLSKGLFHGGYSQSGNVLDSWVVQPDPSVNSLQLAKNVGCGNTSDLIACLRSRPATQLTDKLNSLYKFSEFFPLSLFGPSLEPKKEGAFLEDCPRKILESGRINDVPWLQSVTKNEWLTLIYAIDLKQLDEHWDEVINYIADTYQVTTEEKRLTVARKIRELAFGDEPITENNLGNFIELMSQRQFFGGFQQSSQIQAKVAESPVYDFMSAYVAQNSVYKKYVPPSYLHLGSGAYHGYDMQFLFGGNTGKLNETDEKVTMLYLDMFDSFVKKGIPRIEGVDWKPVTKEEKLDYVVIEGPDRFALMKDEDLGNSEFWNSLDLKECP